MFGQAIWSRRALVTGLLALSALLGVSASRAETPKGEPITLGVSGPLTGQNAQYGAQWKKGFDLALEEINGAGGVNGRPLQYVFEDSQADPRQTVAIAQKFVSDPKHRRRARRLLVDRLDGGLADLSARAARAVRLHQLASRLHQGRRLHVVELASARPTSSRGSPNTPPRSRLQAARRALSQHRLGPHQPRSCSATPPRPMAPRSSRPKAISPTRRISARRSCACATPSPMRSC